MPDKLTVPTPNDLRNGMLRVARSGLIVRGVTNPNVGKDSDYWVQFESVAQQLAVLYANQQVLADQMMPDTATGTDLERILAIFDLPKRAAQPSTGSVDLSSSASTSILTTQQLIDDQGGLYQVTSAATYADGDEVPITAVSTGLATNHPQGTVLQWLGAPAFADSKALVSVGGLIGGVDADTDESARDQLFTYFRNPPGAGNWSQVKGWAELASASVWAAYVYPAINGPATLGVCVLGPLGYDSTLGFTREVSSTTLGIVETYLESHMPEGVNVLVTTPTDAASDSPCIDCDVAIGMSLPLSTAGGGLGGGWVDAVPWPELVEDATYSYVSSITSTTEITITSDDPTNCPTSTNIIAGETTICWFSPANWAAGIDPVVVAIVLTVASSTTGAVRVTLSEPFTDVAVGDYIFPNSENVQAYTLAWLTAMEDMGPGEWTDHPQVIIRGARRPRQIASNPGDLAAVQLRALTDVGDEVLDVDYLHFNVDTPGIPDDTTAASPKVLVPRRLGFFNRIP